MGRIVVFMMIAVSLAPAAFAQGVQTDDIHIQGLIDKVKQNPEAVSQVWSQISSVSPVEAAALLDQIGELAAKPDGVSMDVQNSIHKELGRQTAAFKAAHQAALPARSSKPDDLDDLYAQVFENKIHADPNLTKALAASYETLYIQYGQFVNARFLVANKGGIPTYRADEGNRSSDANRVAVAAEQHLEAYRTNMSRTVTDLKALLNPETARR